MTDEPTSSPYRSAPDAVDQPAPLPVPVKPRRIPRLALPIYAARRCLRDGINAAHAGQLDDAIASLRGYFALRWRGMTTRPTRADAEAALVAATCAALRGDAVELAAVRKAVASDAEVMAPVLTWLDALAAALAGDLARVVAACARDVSPVVAPLRRAVLVLAAERTPATAEQALLGLFDGALGREAASGTADEAKARVLVVLARHGFARGDRMAALSYLRELRSIAPSPFHAFAAALALDRADQERCWRALADDDRDAATRLAALYADCAPAAAGRVLFLVCAPAGADARGALVAAVVGRWLHERAPAEALALVDSEPALADVPIVRAARCHALVALGRARKALALVATGEAPCSVRDRDLALLVAAAANDGERVARLCALHPDQPPPAVVRSAVLVHAATAPALPSLPAWCEQAPDDPDGQYAWALVELRRGRATTALAAFRRAVAAAPALGRDLRSRDPIDVARLHVARDAIRAGDPGLAQSLLFEVENPRLEVEVSRLRALVLIRTAAAREQSRLDAATIGPIVRGLLATLSPGGADHRAVSRLAREADELRARWLLAQDRVDEARPVVRRLGDTGLLAIVLGILDGRPLAELETELAAAGDADMAGVLLAEVRGARGGVDARVEVLEQLRGRGAATGLVDEALVQAYQRARRGLDAKRVALEELREHGRLGAALAAELREALAFEAAAAPVEVDAGHAATGVLPVATLAARLPLLADHARRGGADARTALAEVERALAAGDAAAAATAERAVLVACARSGR
jgi:hypothetical protein